MHVIGLTGGIATGKSSVARILTTDLGVDVIDADQVARQIVEPGQPALCAIVAAFGAAILQPDGSLDRSAMRRRIIEDADARRTLETITHPAIYVQIASSLRELAEAGRVHAVVEAALMVESGSYRNYPTVWVVTCSTQTKLTRVMARDGVSASEARGIIAPQLPLTEKERVATHVIRNESTPDSLREQVHMVWRRLRLSLRSG